MRTMRRSKQQLSQSRMDAILEAHTAGVLSMMSPDGYPYGLPITYVYDQENQRIYFHGAKEGHKYDCAKEGGKASFTVIDKNDVQVDQFDTHFRSVIAFGKLRLVEDEQERKDILYFFGKNHHFTTPHHPDFDGYMERTMPRTAVIELAITGMTGKESIELVKDAE